MEAIYQSHDPEKVRFFAADFWNGTPTQCDFFQTVSGISFPVLCNAGDLGDPDMYNCSYHYVFVIDGDGIVVYRGSVNPAAISAVVDDAVARLDTQVSVGDTPEARALLGANYPNPFNPTTSVPFVVPADGQVSLDIVDLRGRVVRNLVSASRSAGDHVAVFDGRGQDGQVLPSGSYLARLRVAGVETSRVMTLVK